MLKLILSLFIFFIASLNYAQNKSYISSGIDSSYIIFKFKRDSSIVLRNGDTFGNYHFFRDTLFFKQFNTSGELFKDTSKPFVYEELSTIFLGITTIIIFLGTIIAIRNLRVIRKTQSLESVLAFLNDSANVSEDRRFLLREFNFMLNKPKLSEENEKRVKNVINSFNRIGLLIENRLLPSKFVLSIHHSQIIRCWYKLEDYISYNENLIGGRYGRRIARLVTKAKRYHDSNKKHRVTQIKIYSIKGKEPFLIYETNIRTGLHGLFQKLVWMLRRVFKIY